MMPKNGYSYDVPDLLAMAHEYSITAPESQMHAYAGLLLVSSAVKSSKRRPRSSSGRVSVTPQMEERISKATHKAIEHWKIAPREDQKWTDAAERLMSSVPELEWGVGLDE